VNAVYHRSYEQPEPVEVRVNPDCIEVVSYPGPDASIRIEALDGGRIVARRYRNRRLGEFLKELKLTEGRCTGIPKIRSAMSHNGSPPAQFSTDEQRTHFLVVLPVHREFTEHAAEEANAVDKVALNKTDLKILEILKGGEQSRSQLAEALQMSSRSGTLKRSIDKLLELKRIEFTVPDSPRSPNQKLRLPASKDVP
jgi:ATP-dependent DNA helicase RecG